MIVWREKFLATGIHFGVTLIFAAIAAALVFLLWFPDPLQTMIGGTQLFVLVVGCDLALGPLISLGIYNSRKSRRALLVDYTVVGAVQIAALVYGVFVLAGTRPVYVAFSKDRLEVVTAREIADEELDAATNPRYRSLPLLGPRFVAISVPAAERSEALFESLKGNEEHERPRFYVAYESQLEQIRARAKPLADLKQRHPESKLLLEAALAEIGIPAARLRWLPVRHRNGFWTALIDIEDGMPKGYVAVDPY
jgi:hypothetical protein